MHNLWKELVFLRGAGLFNKKENLFCRKGRNLIIPLISVIDYLESDKEVVNIAEKTGFFDYWFIFRFAA